MEIKISTENGRVPVTILLIDGNLDSSSSPQFQKKVAELIQTGTHHILVDFTNSPYVSSAGFRVLNQIFKDLNALHPAANLSDAEIKKGVSDGSYKSPHLKLLNISEQTRTVFTATGFDMFIEEYNDIKKAVASF